MAGGRLVDPASVKIGFVVQKFAVGWAAILLAGALPFAVCAASWETVVDGTSFHNRAIFRAYWGANYPWGTDHNGSARMNATNILVANGVVTLVSSLTNVYEGTSSSSPHLTIRYNSGTFYLKQHILINSQYPLWDIRGRFKVPTQRGCWPAFWMTGANSWPPESDFMEFKGSDGCNQNTYNGRWQVKVTTVATASSAWHTYRVVACLENSTNVDFHYYIDGVMESEQTSTTFVNSPCWLIVDYQMEGSSGSPGPSYTTYAYATNIVVRRLNVAGVGGGPVADGPYRMIARSTGDALDVGNQATAENSTVDQWPYNGGLNQQWIFTHLGAGRYSILGRQSGRALQVADAAISNGASVNIGDFTNGDHQKWLLVARSGGGFSLVNANSGKVMEVSNNAADNLAPIDQWSAAETTFPKFKGAVPSRTGLLLSGTSGIPGAAYSVLGSSHLGEPILDWTMAGAVVCDRHGNFTASEPWLAGTLRHFYRLRLASTNGAANQQWLLQSP